jgi:hypothetical protein
MKKILISAVLVCICSFHVLAGNGKRYGLGLHGGLNFTKLNAQGWVDKYNTNPLGGIYAYYNGKNKFGIQAEILYSNSKVTTDSSFKGLYQQYLGTLVSSISNGNFMVSQIHVPLLVNYKFNSRFWLQGGVMYTANSNVVDKSNLFASAQNIIAANNISAVGGLWIRVPARTSIHARYTLGLKDLNQITNSPEQWYSNTIQLGIGYRFL